MSEPNRIETEGDIVTALIETLRRDRRLLYATRGGVLVMRPDGPESMPADRVSVYRLASQRAVTPALPGQAAVCPTCCGSGTTDPPPTGRDYLDAADSAGRLDAVRDALARMPRPPAPTPVKGDCCD